MLFIVISETLYSYSCNNRKLVCSMLSSVKFQKTSPRSLDWNTGHSGFSEPGCHISREVGAEGKVWNLGAGARGIERQRKEKA